MQLLEFIETVNYPKTDKYDLGYIHEFYNDLFSPRQQSVKNLLEIGMQNGHSMRLWRDYFANADIYGLDINKCHSLTNQNRIHPIYKNAYTSEVVDSFEKNFFDIVIDDGPHTFPTMEFFCKNYLSLVKPGGLLILEDIVDISWTDKFMQLFNGYDAKVIHMAGLAKTTKLQKRWATGLDVIIVQK